MHGRHTTALYVATTLILLTAFNLHVPCDCVALEGGGDNGVVEYVPVAPSLDSRSDSVDLDVRVKLPPAMQSLRGVSNDFPEETGSDDSVDEVEKSVGDPVDDGPGSQGSSSSSLTGQGTLVVGKKVVVAVDEPCQLVLLGNGKKRGVECVPHQPLSGPLFPHEPVAMDVGQGAEGICWFLAAIQGIVNSPIFGPAWAKGTQRLDSADNTVNVRLYGGQCLPKESAACSRTERIVKLAYSKAGKHKHEANWVFLLGKALTAFKRTGVMERPLNMFDGLDVKSARRANAPPLEVMDLEKSHEAVYPLVEDAGGLGTTAFALLLGAPEASILSGNLDVLSEISSTPVWLLRVFRLLEAAVLHGAPATAASRSHGDFKYVRSLHMYTVMYAKRADGDGSPYLVLMDPSDGTKSMKLKSIPLDDFAREIQTVTICQYRNDAFKAAVASIPYPTATEVARFYGGSAAESRKSVEATLATQKLKDLIFNQGPLDEIGICGYLVEGADPNCADDTGLTALMFTIFTDNAELAKALLTKGARPDKKDREGQSALSLLANPKCPSDVKKQFTELFAAQESGESFRTMCDSFF